MSLQKFMDLFKTKESPMPNFDMQINSFIKGINEEMNQMRKECEESCARRIGHVKSAVSKQIKELEDRIDAYEKKSPKTKEVKE